MLRRRLSVRERYERDPRRGRAGRDDRRGDEVRRRSRTWRVLAEAGHRGRRREPRAGPRGEARRATATRSAGTSSGASESNKVKVVNAHLRARATRSTRTRPRSRLEIPALVEVNLSGEETKGGRRARTRSPQLPRAYPDVRGLMTMPPAAGDPEASRAVVPPPARARGGARPARALDGHEPGLPRRRRGGRDVRPRRQRPLRRVDPDRPRGVTIPCDMSFADLWNRTLVYFGIAEENEDWDEETATSPTRSSSRATASARTCAG